MLDRPTRMDSIDQWMIVLNILEYSRSFGACSLPACRAAPPPPPPPPLRSKAERRPPGRVVVVLVVLVVRALVRVVTAVHLEGALLIKGQRARPSAASVCRRTGCLDTFGVSPGPWDSVFNAAWLCTAAPVVGELGGEKWKCKCSGITALVGGDFVGVAAQAGGALLTATV